jgi:D-serine dehydratase
MNTPEINTEIQNSTEFKALKDEQEQLLLNRDYDEFSLDFPISLWDVKEADKRLKRFAPCIAKLFPETSPAKGIIESELIPAGFMQEELKRFGENPVEGELYVKSDSDLPISGSVKARGGIYEVLKHAEDIAFEHKLLTEYDDYTLLAGEKGRALFGQYKIAVGSTGNLGLSIGIMGSALGFEVTVHMSSDARQWKKDLLRDKGVNVVEYDSDYSKAVEEGRRQAAEDEKTYFVDDENSENLFLGYGVAALRLRDQLTAFTIPVDKDHPLFVSIPCGVGGAPGGIAYALKLIFKEHVNPFFVEPVKAPAVALGIITGLDEEISVDDAGITMETAADGLAVGRPSGFVCRTLRSHLAGIATLNDDTLFKYEKLLSDSEKLFVEPSAAAGFQAQVLLYNSKEGKAFLSAKTEEGCDPTHIVWLTGGSMVPEEEADLYLKKGAELLGE